MLSAVDVQAVKSVQITLLDAVPFFCCEKGPCNICDGGCRTSPPSIYKKIDSLHDTLGHFREIDTDGSNGIDYNEFTRFFSFIESHRDTFNSHDHNGDGQISI